MLARIQRPDKGVHKDREAIERHLPDDYDLLLHQAIEQRTATGTSAANINLDDLQAQLRAQPFPPPSVTLIPAFGPDLAAEQGDLVLSTWAFLNTFHFVLGM